MTVLLQLLLLALGFALLVKGADWLVNGATAIARRAGISDLLIGLTVVAFGTSMPELLVNLYASFRGEAGIAMGNIIGSNIANILLILGVAATITPLAVHGLTVWKEIPFVLLSALVALIIANDPLLDRDKAMRMSRADGLILLCFFAIFMYDMVSSMREQRDVIEVPEKTLRVPAALGFVLVGVVGLNLGAHWVVGSASYLAGALGVSDQVIGLSVVAFGTSLPELATSVVAAVKKNADIAIGNVLGSNIFNLFFVLGISATIRPLPIVAAANVDLVVAALATLLLFIFMFTGRKRNLLERWEGVLFLIGYGAYLTYLALWR